ncbi:hypothetical protein AXA84_0264 [Candidatus Phytoplasma oryzae]|uniref:Uncharacterized protein n=1 Tax=Candidatus Phytoplasma oryzae TaxID=203274 RepID=A0A139JQI7_9MOLU|nr:hypothetical protein [Candidatus Phytoplasma oryzae]KXT29235.1 hypothetical protein AXA84_0264 [Candidatus Phytoplasma oryzae]
MKILKYSKKINLNLKFFLSLTFFLCFLTIFLKSNLIFAGKYYSKIQKTDSSDNSIVYLEQKIESLKMKIESLSQEENLFEIELQKSKEKIFSLKMKINKAMSNKSLNLLKLQIFNLQEEKIFYQKEIQNIIIQKIELKTELKKILKSYNKKITKSLYFFN